MSQSQQQKQRFTDYGRDCESMNRTKKKLNYIILKQNDIYTQIFYHNKQMKKNITKALKATHLDYSL